MKVAETPKTVTMPSTKLLRLVRLRNVFVAFLVLVILLYEAHLVQYGVAHNTQEVWFPALMAAVFAVLYLLAEFFVNHRMVITKNFTLLFLFCGSGFFAAKEKVTLYRPQVAEGYRASVLRDQYRKTMADVVVGMRRLFVDVQPQTPKPNSSKQDTKGTCRVVLAQQRSIQSQIRTSKQSIDDTGVSPLNRVQGTKAIGALVQQNRELSQRVNECKQAIAAPRIIESLLQQIDMKPQPATEDLDAGIAWMIVQYYKAKVAVPLSFQSKPTEILDDQFVPEDPSDFQLIYWALKTQNWYRKPAESFVFSLLCQLFFLVASKLISFLLHALVEEEEVRVVDSPALVNRIWVVDRQTA